MIKIETLNNCTFSQITDVWNSAFSNYSVNFRVSVDQLSAMIGRKELLPSSSIVAFMDSRPVGFLLNAIKTVDGVKMAWNGGTGVSPEYQGYGIGNILMEAAMDIYKKEAVEVATLEVITDNIQGVKLYKKYGYEIQETAITYENKEMDRDHGRLSEAKQHDVIKLGSTIDVKKISFYNSQVAWESRCENIFNGHSLVVYDKQGIPLGYTLFKKYTDHNMRTNVIMFQLELAVDISPHNQESTTKTLLTNVLEDVHIGRTGDFVSENPLVNNLLEEFQFKKTVNRFIMNKSFK